MNIQWLKLDVGILDNQKIRLIRKYPDGDSIIVLWVGLMCLGMKSDEPGIVKIADGLPYTTDELATIFEIPVKTVQLGLELFLKYGMIQGTEGGLMEIVDFRKYQSVDEIEFKREQNRIKVAKYRQKQKLLLESDVTVTGNHVTDREEKIRVDKNREDNTIDELFTEFWNKYDYKKGKPKCMSKWKKLSLTDKDNILKALPKYILATPDKQYRKHPATYLNQRSWEDEVIVKGGAEPMSNDAILGKVKYYFPNKTPEEQEKIYTSLIGLVKEDVESEIQRIKNEGVLCTRNDDKRELCGAYINGFCVGGTTC